MATISIADNDARIQHSIGGGGNTANSTQFTIDFPFFALDDINVTITNSSGVDTVLTRGTGSNTFAVTGTAVDDGFSGGNITLGSVYTSSTVTISRDIPIVRTSDFATSGPFNISSLNTELDKVYAVMQQLETKNDRALTMAESDDANEIALPNKASRKGNVLAFNATTGAAEAGPSIGSVTTVSSQSTNINTLAGISSNITTVAGISSNVSTVAGISGNVTTVAGITSNIASVVSNASNINTVAGSISNVNTVAGAISNVNSVASNASNINTVAGKASLITSSFASDMALIDSSFVTKMGLVTSDFVTDMGLVTADFISDLNDIATTAIIADLDLLATSDFISDLNAVEGIKANVTTVAGISSNVTSVAGNSSNINSAVSNASNINAAVSNASNINSAVSNASNINSVVSNATNINTVAGAISNVNSVGGAIANVNTVATNLSGVNSFADRYRVASSAPSSSLDVGDLYFDTTANELKVYKSSGWAAAGSTVNGTSARFHYDISGTPTSVTGSDAAGNTLAYDAGFCDVYVNGVRMSTADITITSGDTVTFASALADGDEVDIVAFGTFTVANIVSTGALNSGSITSGFGNIDTGSSTITTTGVGTFGSLDISGDIDVDGTTNLDVVDIDGALTQDGGAVFNEDSADVDFRVESNGNANMLFVDGGNNRVGIGTNAPATGNGIVIQNTDGASGLVMHRDFSGSNISSATNSNRIEFTISDSATANQAIALISPQATAGTGDALAGNLRIFTSGNDGSIAEQMRVTNDGIDFRETSGTKYVLFKNGDGIHFGASAGSDATGTVLDDYETGTYTPTVASGSGSYSLGDSATKLAYVKIGKMVHLQGQIHITGESSPDNTVTVSLPFASGNSTDLCERAVGSVAFDGSGSNGPDHNSANYVTFFVSTGASFGTFRTVNDNAAGGSLSNSHITTNDRFAIGITYMTFA